MTVNITNLTKRYGSVVGVDDVSFRIENGEFVSLLGPSGCGKTSTLRCIAGLEAFQCGRIEIDGKIVSAPADGIVVPPHERGIGMVFQSYAVWPHMTVEENVAFPLVVRKRPRNEIAAEVTRALEMVDMAGLRARRPSELSGGQQQRIALARAVVGEPKVLLFDEPLSNLDAKLREEMRAEVRRLHKALDVPALYVTHDQEEALSMSDRVIMMRSGNIEQEGSPGEIYRRPNSMFVAQFVGRASFLEVSRRNDSSGWRTSHGVPIAIEDDNLIGTDRCTIMLRPEKVSIYLEDDVVRDRSDVNVIDGVVIDAEFVGAFTQYVIDVGNTTVLAYSDVELQPGRSVSIGFRGADCIPIAG